MSENSNPVETYLSTFGNKITRQQHYSHLKQFFKLIEVKNPETYFTSNRNYESDVTKLWNSMGDYASGTRKMRFGIVISFLIDNDVFIKPRVITNLKTRTKTVEKTIHDTVPTRQELRQILLHGREKERALFLIAVSSGMRIQEILELTLQDIDFESNPVKVTVKAGTSKNRKSRITFISNEAHEALKEWLKVRSKYLQTAQKRAANKMYNINVNDERIFPIDYLTARLWWCRLLHEATDKENNLAEKDTTFEFQRTHYKRHIHTLRKYFRTNLPDEEKASTDVVETLMGHEGYLTKEYRRVPEPRLMKEYLNAVGNVTIFGIDESIVEDKDRQIATLKQQMETLKNDIVNQVINTLKSGQPQLIKELMKQTPTAKVFADGSTEF